MSLDQSSIPVLGKGRLEALTDSIFATVMTDLGLSLSVPVIIYGANIIATSFCMLGILSYSARNSLLVVPEHDRRVVERIRARWRTGPWIYLAAILLSFLSPLVSFAVYVGALIFLVIQSSFGFRHRHRTGDNF